MAPIHALVHTQGTVVTNRYLILEVAYVDVTGATMHCHVKSPLSFGNAKRINPGIRSDVIMTNEHGVSYASVLNFLCDRYRCLQEQLNETEIVFGYRGNNYQPKILRDTGLPHIVNIESLGTLPSLKTLLGTSNGGCPFHTRDTLKCARRAVEFMWNALHQQKILSFQRVDALH